MIITPCDALDLCYRQLVDYPHLSNHRLDDLTLYGDTGRARSVLANLTAESIYGEDLPSSPTLHMDESPSWPQWADYWGNCLEALEFYYRCTMISYVTRRREDLAGADSATRHELKLQWAHRFYELDVDVHRAQAGVRDLCDLVDLCDRLEIIHHRADELDTWL